MALLLLAHAALPGRVEAATVDHGLRAESAQEAALVARLCERLGVPHETLAVEIRGGSIQASARAARYGALGAWMERRELAALASAHHADDQAETLLMRLNRGSGVAGLSGVRARGPVPGCDGTVLLRPLLGWRRTELELTVAMAGIEAVQDPSNDDDRFDRARMRKALSQAEWLDIGALARSAANLAEGDESLDWAAQREWTECVGRAAAGLTYRPLAPRAVRLRVLERAIREVGGGNPRGAAVAALHDALEAGEGGNLAGVLATVEGGAWLLEPEPARSA